LQTRNILKYSSEWDLFGTEHQQVMITIHTEHWNKTVGHFFGIENWGDSKRKISDEEYSTLTFSSSTTPSLTATPRVSETSTSTPSITPSVTASRILIRQEKFLYATKVKRNPVEKAGGLGVCLENEILLL
jgi:hypothetical protein